MDSMILRTSELGPPDDYVSWGPDGSYDTGISNFDHMVLDGVEDYLKEHRVYTLYAGWNFNGRVWWDAEGAWSCQVWEYGSPRATVRADTLENLMTEVSDEWGWD